MQTQKLVTQVKPGWKNKMDFRAPINNRFFALLSLNIERKNLGVRHLGRISILILIEAHLEDMSDVWLHSC